MKVFVQAYTWGLPHHNVSLQEEAGMWIIGRGTRGYAALDYQMVCRDPVLSSSLRDPELEEVLGSREQVRERKCQ